MLDDDLDPLKRKKVAKNLHPMSLDELNAYIEDMKEEIKRAEQEIARKKSHMDAVSNLFKT